MNSLDELHNYIHTLKAPLQQGKELESYLLAIYKNLTDNKQNYINTPPTLSLIANILEACIVSQPAIFDKNWLSINQSPDPNRFSRKFTNPSISDNIDKTNLSALQGLDFTLAVLEFQIAELYKMRGKQLIDEQRYYGINSATGHRWYNFDPYSNLSCGLACMIDNDEDISQLNWSFIGNLLEDGRIYE